MKQFLVIFLLGITLSAAYNSGNSQDTSINRFLPLQVGNSWVYYYNMYAFTTGGNGYERYTVTDTLTINGKVYFHLEMVRRVITGPAFCSTRIFNGSCYLRIDSSTGNIYRNAACNQQAELFVDSTQARLNDVTIVCGNFQGNSSKCVDTGNINLLGSVRKSKNFRVSGFEGFNSHIYAKDIGLSAFSYQQLMSTCNLNLRGCLIGGVLYGDTNVYFVGINQISSEVPNEFSLSQNYPNPFNPATKIKFQIPKSAMVKLTVFDALGREVETLVNQQLSPGTYQADFDGSSLPSGVYYYMLESESFTQTKKMVLIK